MRLLCTFVPFSFEQVVGLIKGVTGWPTGHRDPGCRRTLTLLRMFNIREGFTDDDDMLPDRTFTVHEGGIAGKKPLQQGCPQEGIVYYYSLMGWDARGIPTPETLQAYDIDWAVKM